MKSDIIKNMESKTPEQLQAYVKTKSEFTDYTRFQDENSKRLPAREDFIAGKEYAPAYEYPALDSFYDLDEKGKAIADKKSQIYEAVMELRAHLDDDDISSDEYELYAQYHEVRLKRIMLVEAARRLHHTGASGEQVVARNDFMRMNAELYGEMDAPKFDAMMHTEADLVANFVPADQQSEEIKAYLDAYMSRHEFVEVEKPLLDPELVVQLNDFVLERYSDILAVVPETDESVIYDAEACREIMQQALAAGGLEEKGWQIVISSKRSNVATNSSAKKIYIPNTTTRTADELKRLILHEQEVHARRGQNGDDANVSVLKFGTADYADVEEGLGVILECAVAGTLQNPSFDRARDRYITAGLALGVDGIPKDARSTYDIVWRLLAVRNARDGTISDDIVAAAKSKAMDYVDNAFRGTNYAAPGIIYTKLKVYYEGLVKNAEYLAEHRDNLDEAFDVAMVGKCNHTDSTEVENVQSLVALAA